jgi:aryl-alcohol dehydrogenase-like predicted oxidoreductase
MNYRKLGRTGLEVSEVGYGAWGISGKQWIGATDDASLTALRAAIEGGLNFIDTALAYGEGKSEELVGQAIRDAAGKVYVATKVPPKNRRWPAQPGIGIEDVFPTDYVIESTETSLRNLKMEQVDLQQLHVWNPDWLERDEWRRAFETIKAKGYARFVGISINDHQPDSALGIIKTGLIDTVQVIYNVFDQSPEANLYPACLEYNIGVLARVPFDEGGLTGRIDESTEFPEGDFRAFYFRGDRKKQIVDRVDAIVRDLGLSGRNEVATAALRFCLSHPAVSTVIPGMRSLSSVQSNLAASDAGPLSATQLATLHKHAWDRNFYL